MPARSSTSKVTVEKSGRWEVPLISVRLEGQDSARHGMIQMIHSCRRLLFR